MVCCLRLGFFSSYDQQSYEHLLFSRAGAKHSILMQKSATVFLGELKICMSLKKDRTFYGLKKTQHEYIKRNFSNAKPMSQVNINNIASALLLHSCTYAKKAYSRSSIKPTGTSAVPLLKGQKNVTISCMPLLASSTRSCKASQSLIFTVVNVKPL